MSDVLLTSTHPIFTPTAIAAERLDDATVGRDEVIERVADRVRDAARSGARRHTLLVGSRGSGKTHTLSVALHRALADPVVAQSIAVASIQEDALSISSYADLLVEIARSLDSNMVGRAQELRRSKKVGDLERLLEGHVGQRALVLAIENLDRVFRELGRADSGALRGFVETNAHVLVLASTPLLFSGVTSRSEPWYGSFDVEHLQDLSVEEGAEIVRRRAVGRGKPDLAAYVMSPQGESRLRAVAHLAGGSPRLWQILAEAVTISSLDELVPAVEKLLDDLAPYYQQRLWELGGIDQKLVVELGRSQGAMTVTELSALTGVEPRAAATALGRLADASWVRSEKAPGGDQRRSWYELREPLLRHHLQYRESRGEPLRVLVEVLRGWYSVSERRQHLAWAERGSVAERLLATTILGDPKGRSDAAYASRDADELMAEVRSWRVGTCTSAVVGSLELSRALEESVEAARSTKTERSVPDVLGDSLTSLLGRPWSTRDHEVLTLIAAGWNGRRDPESARDLLLNLLGKGLDGALGLLVREEVAFWIGEAGDPDAARDQYTALLPDQDRFLGPDHPDTLSTRFGLAYWTGEAGDPDTARDQYTALLPDVTRVLGPDHPDTLNTRGNLANWTGEAGDPDTARDQYTALLPDVTRVLGPDHPDTLTTRANLAGWTGEAGDPDTARDQYTALLRDRVRVLGPDHPATLTTRGALALVSLELGAMPAELDGSSEEVINWVSLHVSSHSVTPDRSASLTRGLAGLPGSATIVEATPILQLLRLKRPGSHRDWIAAYRAAGGPVQGVTDNVATALDGDPESLMRLPEELRDLVTQRTAVPG
ncbi:MAG: tetratricopeptide repeat protein [Dermatophilaceae bacterium]